MCQAGSSCVRKASLDDAAAIAEVYLSSRRAASPSIPPGVHSDAEVHAWVRELLVPECEVYVTVDDDEVVAFMALDGDMLEQLYVAPLHQRIGHGARLLGLAQTTRESLVLWTFEGNLGARCFYEAHGFTQSGEASTNNEEHAPALCYRWIEH